MNRVSRREFVALGFAGAATASLVRDPGRIGAAALSAQELVDRIRKNLGVAWNATTVDTFKAGDPSTVVTGVTTTSLATIDVMRRAVKAGANMVITSGPTFYSRADSPTPSADPVFSAKSEFIKRNNLVVWRFSDHWRLRTPDPFTQGLTETLGWARYRSGNDPQRVTVPAVTLDELVADMKTKLNARGGLRIVGNPRSRVRTIGLRPGTIPLQAALTHLPHVDAIVTGEVREWECSEYVRDSVTAGLNKSLILIGRTLSEDGGMKLCAEWLQTIVSEAPIRWMPAGDPYWRPAT